jgi:hypothetical protein
MSLPSTVLTVTLAALALLAGCGDDGAATTDARATDAAVDGAACAPVGYPASVMPVSVDLIARSTLTLDGAGTRCEQIVRALLSPGRPAELMQLDTVGVTGTCTHDDLLDREIVRLRAPLYAGVPVFTPVQDALVHVDAANTVVFLHGDFLPAGHAPPAGCLDGPTLAARVPGRSLDYQRFMSCEPGGPGAYTVAPDDVIEPGPEGVYLDGDGELRRVRAVEVYLLPAHASPEVINSDAFCCSGPTLDRCVGKRLFLDAVTGDVVGQAARCITC